VEVPLPVTDPCAVIVDAVVAVESDLDPDVVADVVAGTLRQRPVQRQVALILQADPQLLTSGRSEGPRSIERLIRALRDRGARHVVLPRCARCGHARPLQSRDGDLRICGQCTARERAAACAVCSRVRRVAHRDRLGRPRCAYCPRDGGDPIESICVVVDSLGLGVTRQMVVRAVARGVPRAAEQRRLSWALQNNPALLTGHAAHGPLVVVDLIEALIAEGAPRRSAAV
jgi:hypothetical protein